MQTVVYVISRVSHSKLFEWTFRRLDKSKYRIIAVLMHHEETAFENFLRSIYIPTYRINYSTKYDLPAAILRCRKIFRKEKVDIVHTHLFEAGLAGITAARLTGVKRRIHTRHDALIHHDYHPAAVKYDRWINRLSTDIVAITENVKSILVNMENADPRKITVIHHRFELSEFRNVNAESVIALRNKYLPDGKQYPVVGVVSRFIEWKGIQYTITAFNELLKSHPDAVLLLANAQGPYSATLTKMLENIPERNYRIIPFETEIQALYRLFDIFIHVPVSAGSEAFGQVYIEAMAARVPCIITLSGIASEFVQHRKHALVVPYRNSELIKDAIFDLLNSEELRSQLVTDSERIIGEQFSIEEMINEIEALYDRNS
jgi:glycosyltransferase involved in cell wall biosynthesis